MGRKEPQTRAKWTFELVVVPLYYIWVVAGHGLSEVAETEGELTYLARKK